LDIGEIEQFDGKSIVYW